MHDDSLGPPCDIGVQPDALHRGPCFDGVFGCHLCWNAANDGKGTQDCCDSCGKDALTRVCRSSDEPGVSYAWCEPCRFRIAEADARENEAALDDAYEWESRHTCEDCGALFGPHDRDCPSKAAP